MIIQPANRVEGLKEYYFSTKNREIASISSERRAEGKLPVINLGIGAPDRMPPMAAIEALCDSAHQSGSHKYENYKGTPELRGAFADWYRRWYHVELDPETQIQPLVGSKEGILITSLAFLNAGDKVLVPNPGYPTYTSSARIAQAEVVSYPLVPEKGFYPDFDYLESLDLTGVKMMWINYPNMPTGAHASLELYAKVVDFALRHSILVCNDNPYSFVLNDNPLSIFQIPGAFECCIEFNSLSKALNMSGWRIGMVAGAPEIVAELLKVKSQMDSGMFRSMQMAAVKAVNQGPEWYEALNSEYRKRQVVAERIMARIGAEYTSGGQGLFVWGRLREDNPLIAGYRPEKTLGERMSDFLLYEKGVFLTPGMVFGTAGNDYVRISLCAGVPDLERVLEVLD